MNDSPKEEVLTSNFKYKELFIEGNKYLVGVRKINNNYQVLLTNLIKFYEETLTKQDVVERCKELNPALDDFNFEEIVNVLLTNIPQYLICCTPEIIQLESKIDEGRFWFYIKLSETSSETFHSNATENLYASFFELHNRYNCLLDIVRKKDQEIAEYKARGTVLLRKSLITETFTEDSFQKQVRNIKPIDKMKVFSDAMNFYDCIKSSPTENKESKQKLCTDSDSSSNILSQAKTTDHSKSIKRPSSNELRCAVPPKLERKVEAPKQKSHFKFL